MEFKKKKQKVLNVLDVFSNDAIVLCTLYTAQYCPTKLIKSLMQLYFLK